MFETTWLGMILGIKNPKNDMLKVFFSAWFLGATHQMVAGWWLNRPIWKILVKMGIFPRGENKRQLKPPPNGGKSFLDTLSPIGCAKSKILGNSHQNHHKNHTHREQKTKTNSCLKLWSIVVGYGISFWIPFHRRSMGRSRYIYLQ